MLFDDPMSVVANGLFIRENQSSAFPVYIVQHFAEELVLAERCLVASEDELLSGACNGNIEFPIDGFPVFNKCVGSEKLQLIMTLNCE